MNAYLKLGAIALLTGTLTAAASTGHPNRPDPWITTKTKLALLTAENVPGTKINVDTVNGRVTLHGKVETAAQKARATEISKQVEGVTEVRNLLQIVPDSKAQATNLSDAVITTNVTAALESDPALDDSHIRTQSVNKGVVLLGGKAESLSAHLRAVRIAAGVNGVRRVASEVESPDTLADREIRREESAPASTESGRSAGSTFSDMWITTAAKMRLLADGDTPALEINVDTENGVVTLFGIVPTPESKQAAEADVKKVSGVIRVDNALQVVPAGEQKAVEVRDDVALEAAKSALLSKVAFANVSVEVKNGAARLTGTVPNESDWLMAAVTVRGSRGIRSVNNDLIVERD